MKQFRNKPAKRRTEAVPKKDVLWLYAFIGTLPYKKLCQALRIKYEKKEV